MLTLRPGRVDDAAPVAALIERLAGTFLSAPDGRGAEPFFASVSAGAQAAYLADPRYRYLVAEQGGTLAGFIALRDGSHVFHLFVEPAWQRRGIAAALWARVRDEALGASATGFTVNAALPAVPVYAAFGFVAEGPPVEAHGVRFLPMRWRSARRDGDETA